MIERKISLTNIVLYFVYLLISINYFNHCCVLNNIYTACKKGYNRTNCKQKCFFPSYGLGCQRQCNCVDKVCDHIIGCMQPTRDTFVIKSNFMVIYSNWKDLELVVSLFRQLVRVPSKNCLQKRAAVNVKDKL